MATTFTNIAKTAATTVTNLIKGLFGFRRLESGRLRRTEAGGKRLLEGADGETPFTNVSKNSTSFTNVTKS